MVSFSCEACGDVLTKKKLDPHRNQCYGASFTCIDCMTHFQGTSYRSHTSCISEAQKYQGALYKDPKKKGQQNQKNANKQNNANGADKNTSQAVAVVPKNTSVTDGPDNGTVAVVDAPPHAPSPPPVNVFDFLVNDATPNPSKTLAPPEDVRMIEDGSQEQRESAKDPQDRHNQQNGFSYDAANSAFVTPAPKSQHDRPRDADVSTTKKSERKRKRGHVESLDMSAVKYMESRDTVMTDAPPVLHSGLTGGLNRLLSRPEFPPSPDYSGADRTGSPVSPLKRSKHTKTDAKASKESKERGRDREPRSRKTSSSGQTKATSKEEERRHRRKHKHRSRSRSRSRGSSHDSDSSDARRRHQRRSRKAIEYRRPSDPANPNDAGALVLHRKDKDKKASASSGSGAGATSGEQPDAIARAEFFMSFVTKGPDSERGVSLNKALKRYHRERYERWDGPALPRAEEEKELWKSLRLKRNERGEIVLLF